MGLAADRPTLDRTKDPAHSVTPRQQRYLAVRGASSMIEHPAFLSWSGRTGCPTPVSPTGDRGFESVSLHRRVHLTSEFRGDCTRSQLAEVRLDAGKAARFAAP